MTAGYSPSRRRAGMSFPGSKKGTGTTTAYTGPSVGRIAVNSVPRAPQLAGIIASAMLLPTVGEKKALVMYPTILSGVAHRRLDGQLFKSEP